MHFTFVRLDSVTSTNTEAAELAKRGADEGVCVIATQQTAGRGRHGRTWISEPGAGSYLSIVLRPGIEARKLPLITLIAGISVYDALSKIGLEPDIKWANDVLVREKKISGILAETVDTPRGLAVVVGIGINLRSDSLPAEIAERATSVEAEGVVSDAASEGHSPISEMVERTLLQKLDHWYGVLSEPGGDALVLDAVRERSSYLRGKQVRVHLPNETIEGLTDDIEPDGALRIKLADGSVTIVHAGDIERLRSA